PITFIPRLFDNRDKLFWQKYEISSDNLVEDKVVPTKIYSGTSRKGELFSFIPADICYSYTEFDNDRVKIYRPYADKKAKWLTNCKSNDVGSINHLPYTGELLVI